MLQGHFNLAASGVADDLAANEYIVAMGTGNARFDGDNSQSTVVYLVQWGSHKSFIDYLLGYSTYGALGSNPSNLYRELPEQHPEYVAQYAYTCDVVPEGFDEDRRSAGQNMVKTEGALSEQGIIQANLARITTTYRALPFNVQKDEEYTAPEYNRYTLVENDFATETINITGRMQFYSTNNALDHAPPILANLLSRTVTWFDIPADGNDEFVPANWVYIKQCVGRINSTEFMNEPAGTVLFLAPKFIPKRPNAANATKLFDVVMPFQIKNNGYGVNYYLTSSPRVIGVDAQRMDIEDDWAGWNYFYNQNLGANNRFDLLTHDRSVGGRRAFSTAELNNLFKLTQSP